MPDRRGPTLADALPLLLERLGTPIGELAVVTDVSGCLRATEWTEEEAGLLRRLRLHYGEGGFSITSRRVASAARGAIRRYFDGDLAAIDGLSVETGGTEFQRSVWRALREIPCGSTRTYSEVALAIGRPDAVRAVGMANGSNPVPIVVPCHRVVGADGTLTGYGGGLDRKRWLLAHEAAAATLPLLSQSS